MKTVILFSILLAMPVSGLRAEKHALLIGVSTYNPQSNLPNLDGPKWDIAAFRELLTGPMGFSPANVHVLQDEKATLANILEELNQLKARVKPGDYVVFYYSGHGTSYGDPAAKTWGLDPNTGAMLPYDIIIGTADQVRSKLLVGKQHLRPVFEELDHRATLFAIFDTCYSADSAKSIKIQRSRYVSLSQLVKTESTRAVRAANDLDADTQTMSEHQDRSPFPYHHVISLSAAGKFQPAGDISLPDVQRNPNLTFDHHPHGVLTNSLLKGMKGEADKNHDGVVSHDELYTYLQEASVSWSHKPVLQTAADAGKLLSGPAFEAPARTTAAPPKQEPPKPESDAVCVKAENLTADLLKRIQALPRVRIADSCATGLIARPANRGGYDLFQSTGVAILEKPLSADDLIARIAAEPEVQDLLNLSYYNQSFDVDLRMVPDDRSVYTEGTELKFTAKTGAPAYLMLLNIDITGAVTIVYPYHEDLIAPAQPGAYTQLGKSGMITGPFGIEYMKLIAFRDKPQDFDHWKSGAGESYKTLDPGSLEFQRLMKMLRSQPARSAETRLRLVTAPGKLQ